MHLGNVVCSVRFLRQRALGVGARMGVRVNWQLAGTPTHAQYQMRKGRQKNERA